MVGLTLLEKGIMRHGQKVIVQGENDGIIQLDIKYRHKPLERKIHADVPIGALQNGFHDAFLSSDESRR